MRKTVAFFFALACVGAVHGLEGFSFGFDQFTRAQKSENSFLLAPGGEAFFSAHRNEWEEARVSAFAGRYFGTAVGLSVQYNRYFGRSPKRNVGPVWQPGVGAGAYGAWQDILFTTRSSRDYVYPAPADFGVQFNLIPFRFASDTGSISFAECSVGTDFAYFLKVVHVDLRIFQFSFRL